MPLATKNGSLILKSGMIAETCECCDECQNHSFYVGNLPYRGCGGGGKLYGERTITIPDKHPLPCEVTITGFIDDDLAIDGSVVEANKFAGGQYANCNPAHNVCYTFTASSRTFTIAAIDNYGINTSYNLTICFNAGGACCESGGCTVKKECECNGVGQTFKGVGTTCTPSSCPCCNSNGTPKVVGSDCGLCYCYCTANGGTIPRFVNVTLSWTWATDRNDCSETRSTSVTLSRIGTSTGDGFSGGGTTGCYSWDFTGDGFYVSVSSAIGPSNEGLTASVTIRNTKCSRPNGDTLRWTFSLNSQKDKKTTQTGIGQGLCFDRHAGATSTQSTVVDGWPSNPPYWQGLSGAVTGAITINGFQE